MNDFNRVATVIRYLDEHHVAQPALDELAAAVRLSESHFHRLFHRWAGVTPKDFLQCLTAEHAKRRLRDSASVLDSALDSGLSGPGRLHDLLVSIDAASPGEIKTGGRGLRIEWGRVESPFGPCSLAWTTRGICHLAFDDPSNRTGEPPELRRAWPNAELHRNEREAARRAESIFHHDPLRSSPLQAFVRGTEFQLKVWRALVLIPEGCVASYQRIADAIGVPRASRAVGAACGANPVAWLIPCHRVIRETGIVQGYRWGSERKRMLLAMEAAKASSHRWTQMKHR